MDNTTVEAKIINDKSKEYIEAMEKAVGTTLEALGLTVERYAKEKCTVDTGLLRNSITYAVGGGSPAIDSYSSNSKHESTGKPVDPIRTGSYSGNAPNEKAVFVGTNVEYAPYVEMGHHTPSGTFVAPKPFLKPALADHTDEYINIIKKHMQPK